MTFEHAGLTNSATALLDTQATLNAMPNHLGRALGFDWQSTTTLVRLTGEWARFEARSIRISARIGHFAPVWLDFAWSQSDAVPLVLGRINFLTEFKVHFIRAERVFELQARK
jgi:hypothetical protein